MQQTSRYYETTFHGRETQTLKSVFLLPLVSLRGSVNAANIYVYS